MTSVVNSYECAKGTDAEIARTEAMAASVPDARRSDHELVEAARGGDEQAFGEIIARYRSPITNFLYRFLNDYDEAVDLAQETFVRVYFALERYHTKFAFSTYIYRIASNLAISEIRRRKRRRLISLTGYLQSDDNSDVEYDPPDVRRSPEAETVENERNAAIVKAIASLPEKYRLPIVLRDIEGRSYEEVAEIMELGLGTTKSRISRGRGLLRAKLEGFLD